MKKILEKIILIFSTIILSTVKIVYASADEIYSIGTGNSISNAGAIIAGWIRYGALVVAVVMLMVHGIKFMIASPEAKADAKKNLIPWAIGLVLVFMLNLFLSFIANGISQDINKITV